MFGETSIENLFRETFISIDCTRQPSVELGKERIRTETTHQNQGQLESSFLQDGHSVHRLMPLPEDSVG